MVVTTEGFSRLECSNVCTVVVARPLQSLSGVSHPKEISAPIITISTNNRIQKGKVRKHGRSKAGSESYPFHYMEPSYLIWTCCDWIAPVLESRLGLTKTWYTLVTVDSTLPFLSNDWPVTKTRKLRLRVAARL